MSAGTFKCIITTVTEECGFGGLHTNDKVDIIYKTLFLKKPCEYSTKGSQQNLKSGLV